MQCIFFTEVTTMQETPAAVNLFFSYAHEDQDLRDRLEEHLSILKRLGKISTWHDRKIRAGSDWAGEISEELESADIILLLVSPSFINSDYCYGVEVDRALQRHKQGNAVVIPIILRPAVWEDSPFGKLQALPIDAKPVTKWRNRDDAFANIVKGIAERADELARKKLSSGTSTTTGRYEPASSQSTESTLKAMKFVLIHPGTFLMGSANGDTDQKPVHEVTISRSFYMGAYVVTQGEWKAIMSTEPWKGREFVGNGDNYPATYITWTDCKTFIARLNSRDSENYYRLPTEAEWEYAARAGTTTKFSFGDDENLFNAYGWYSGNSYEAGFRHPHEVGSKRPNGWGLYDMHGNVWEWVEDWYHGSYSEQLGPEPMERVLRGGGYDYPAKGSASAYRYHNLPIRTNHVIGFRLVREAL
jgi:formylglycine-generating enzyme required for sulfatase activity